MGKVAAGVAVGFGVATGVATGVAIGAAIDVVSGAAEGAIGTAGVIGRDGAITEFIIFSGAAKGSVSGRIVVTTVVLVAVLLVEFNDSKVAVDWLNTGGSVA
jgi:hypothetical protein